MAKNETAESRSLKSNEKLKLAGESCSKERPSKLTLLTAVLNFVGGLGRALEYIDKFIGWLDGSS